MPAGLQVFNAGGSIQIDETYRNYGLRQVIPVPVTAYYTSPPNPAGYAGMPYKLTVSGSQDLLIACRAEVLQPIMLHSYFDGATWTFNWVFVIPGTDPVTETVQFYVFDVLPLSGFSNVGLEVFKADGSRVFHSDCAPMRVGGVLSGDQSFIGDAGRSYVPLIMLNSIHSVFFPGIAFRAVFYALRVSGSNIIPTAVSPGAFNSFGPANSGAYAAIDVTGL